MKSSFVYDLKSSSFSCWLNLSCEFNQTELTMDRGQASTFYNPGAGTGPRDGGGVYQNFTAPSTTFINIFSQPGTYNVSLSFAGAAGRENPATGLHGGLINRQVPMTAGAQANGAGGIPMMNRPINPGEQELQNNLSPYLGSPIKGRGGPTMIPEFFGTPEGQKLPKPVPPPKPVKRLAVGTQTTI
ncbi:hypothetical protein Ocin01_17288 [Orchesella cincta]|uniref:Uncharacterized protein n=1 Tax=Orchesella cincta TaxID=48709 RepID=A0A1D2M8Y8_ORCCI|nr:hypothetical protein Ocin01_17288 [Orchesella cincta]